MGPGLLERFEEPSIAAIHAQGAESGTCGRLALRLPAWLAIRGYDQEPGTHGSGFQDIDLRKLGWGWIDL